MSISSTIPLRRFALCCLFLVGSLVSSTIFAQDSRDDSYIRAAAAFESGDYERAENLYRSLIKDGHFSEDVFYNLGNTLFRRSNFGEATLNFRRAQFFSPRMTEATQNLAVLEKQLGFLKFEPKGVDEFLLKFRPSELLWLATLGGWAALISFALTSISRKLNEWRPLFSVIIIFGVALAATSGWGWKERTTRLSTDSQAIVISPAAEARVAPTPDAEAVIALPPGSEVRKIVTRGPWEYIEVPGPLRGWVRSEEIEGIWPMSAPTEATEAANADG